MTPADLLGNEAFVIDRFAALLTGSEAAGDRLMKRATAELGERGRRIKGHERRLDFFWTLIALASRDDDAANSDAGAGHGPQSFLLDGLHKLPTRERAAVLLYSLGTLAERDAAQVLDMEPGHFASMARERLQEIVEVAGVRILIMEDEPIIAMDLESIVRDLGFDVTGVATNYEDAIAAAAQDPPDLILADIQLADGYSGKQAIIEILARQMTQVIFVTAFPEQLLTGDRPEPTFLITKPFQRRTVRSAILQAIMNAKPRAAPDEPDVPAPSLAEAADRADGAALRSQPAPIDAFVEDAVLRLRERRPPEAAVSADALNHLREHHLRSIERLLAELEGMNGVGSLRWRLNELARLLAAMLTEESALAIGVSVDGLSRLVPVIRDQLLDLPATDLHVLILDLEALCEQFPVYRRFRDEARTTEPLDAADREALQEIVSSIVDMPDEIVDPDLKRELSTLPIAEDAWMSDLAVKRSVANVLKAIARGLKNFARDVGADARGRAVAGLGFLIVSLPTGEALSLLGASHPIEFAAVAGVLASASRALKATEEKKE